MESTRRPERRTLNSRSLIASTLLGRHPATLSGKLLVALGELFGIASGTTRVALSRMVQNGELVNDDGMYTLAGALAERQQRQDASRKRGRPDRSSAERKGGEECEEEGGEEGDEGNEWGGAWEQWVVREEARSADQRAQLRRAANALKLAELRDGVWLRPANLDSQRLPDALAVLADQAVLLWAEPAEPLSLVRALWDLDEWASIAEELLREIQSDQISAIPESFGLASEVVRHLLYDPALPAELLPPKWPGDRLRTAYNRHEKRLLKALNNFYQTVP